MILFIMVSRNSHKFISGDNRKLKQEYTHDFSPLKRFVFFWQSFVFYLEYADFLGFPTKKEE